MNLHDDQPSEEAPALTRRRTPIFLLVVVTSVLSTPIQTQNIGIVIGGSKTLELQAAGVCLGRLLFFSASALLGLRLGKSVQSLKPGSLAIALEFNHSSGLLGLLIVRFTLVFATRQLHAESLSLGVDRLQSFHFGIFAALAKRFQAHNRESVC